MDILNCTIRTSQLQIFCRIWFSRNLTHQLYPVFPSTDTFCRYCNKNSPNGILTTMCTCLNVIIWTQRLHFYLAHSFYLSLSSDTLLEIKIMLFSSSTHTYFINPLNFVFMFLLIVTNGYKSLVESSWSLLVDSDYKGMIYIYITCFHFKHPNSKLFLCVGIIWRTRTCPLCLVQNKARNGEEGRFCSEILFV